MTTDHITEVNGVQVWVLPSMKTLVTPVGAGNRGTTTAIAWVRWEDEPDDVVIYGIQNGYLACWKLGGVSHSSPSR